MTEEIDIETSTLSDRELRDYIIQLYTNRDKEILAKSGINVLEFMIKKVEAYKLKTAYSLNQSVEKMDFRKFYSSLTLDALVTLGY